MMAHNRAAVHMLLGWPDRRPDAGGSGFSLATRVKARLYARRWDDALERTSAIPAASVLACHAARITGFDEREHLARSLRAALRVGAMFAVPVDRRAVAANAALIEQVALRLHAPSPVRARGMARLRLLLSDGRGPLYRPGRGSLTAQLRGVLAAL